MVGRHFPADYQVDVGILAVDAIERIGGSLPQDKRLDDLRSDMNRRFDDVDRRLGEVRAELQEVRAEFRELRADMRSHFRWTVTPMVALFGVAVPVWMWVLSLILQIR